MPQFHQALKALRNENTKEFNRLYAVTPPPSPPVSPAKNMKKVPSQFELASLALREGSPIPFNEKYAVSSPHSNRRKTRRMNRKQRKASRKQRRTK